MAFQHSNTHHGQLTINSFALMNPAMRVENLQVLHSKKNRGASVLIPNVAGMKSRQRRRDSITFTGLQLTILGECSYTGTPAVGGNQYYQLDENMLVVQNAIVTPPSGNDGYDATWLWRDGASATGKVFVDNWQTAPDPTGAAINRVVFDMTLDAGDWAVSG